jgi:hypothetical protein
VEKMKNNGILGNRETDKMIITERDKEEGIG